MHNAINVSHVSKSFLNDLTYEINGIAISIHKALGPGLLESVYHQCMAHELTLQKIKFESELTVPILYKEIRIQSTLRCDFFIENCIVVELKGHEKILRIHEAQTMTYMKLLHAPKGIIYNFNVVNLYSEGQKTYVNNLFRNLPE